MIPHTHTLPAYAWRQPAAADALTHDMNTLWAQMQREDDKLLRAQSRKRRASTVKNLDRMAERYEAMREEREKMEMVF